MGFFKKIFGKIFHGVARIFGAPSSAEKRQRKSLLEEQSRSQEAAKKSEQELKRKKDQLISLRRSVKSGKKSLMSSWYDENTQDSTIGS